MVKFKKEQYKQKIFNSLTDTFNKKPKDYWEILRALKGKKNVEDEIPEILKDETKVIKHIQQQGNPDITDNTFVKEIEEKLKEIDRNIQVNEKTDSPITFSEVKIIRLKKGKAPGPDNIINEIIKYSKNVTIKSMVKLFNLILNTGIYPSVWKNSFVTLLPKKRGKK